MNHFFRDSFENVLKWKRTNENRTNQGLGVDSRAISVSVKSAAIVETNDRFEVVQIVEKYWCEMNKSLCVNDVFCDEQVLKWGNQLFWISIEDFLGIWIFF